MFLKTCMRLLRGLLFDDRCVVCRQSGSCIHMRCRGLLSPAPSCHDRWITPVWNYRDPRVKGLIAKIKKQPRTDIIEVLTIRIPNITEENVLVVPIPASPERMKKERFNQALVIAKQITKHIPNAKVADILEHTGITREKQALTSSRRVRLTNRKGCYAIKPDRQEEMIGATILLIDDITTTGATMNEARRILEKAGAQEVYGYVLVH